MVILSNCLIAQLLQSQSPSRSTACHSKQRRSYGDFCGLKSCHLRHLIGLGSPRGGRVGTADGIPRLPAPCCVALHRMAAPVRGDNMSHSICRTSLWPMRWLWWKKVWIPFNIIWESQEGSGGRLYAMLRPRDALYYFWRDLIGGLTGERLLILRRNTPLPDFKSFIFAEFPASGSCCFR